MYQTRASGATADFFFSLTQPNERTFQPNERTKRYVKYVGLETLKGVARVQAVWSGVGRRGACHVTVRRVR